MKRIQKWTAFFLTLALLAGLGLPLPVRAAENAPTAISYTYINPLYADVITEADLTPPRQPSVSTYEAQKYATTIEEAGMVLREGMKERQENISVYYQMPREDYAGDEFASQIHQIADYALAHTGNPIEGDYLQWQYGGWKASGTSQATESGGEKVYQLSLTYACTYYTTAAQEQEMDKAVETLLEDLGVSSATDYLKLRTIYDYICANVTYDHTNLNDDSYKLKYTAYAALMNRTAVCQGYAVLFYRLALELGVDARLIPGTASNGEPHGWNIAQLKNLYYDLDSTWDAGETNYSYFLKCDENFTGHTRYEDYTTEAFYAEYPMSSMDFVPTDEDTTCTTHNYKGKVTTNATCTAEGVKTYTCTICGDTYTESIPTTEHSWDEGVVTKEPTETATGIRTYTCTVCKATKTEEIPVKEHEHSYTAVVTNPTCTEKGYTTFTCACGYSYKGDYVDALGHDLVNPTYNSSAKTHTFSCSRCDYTETKDCTFDEGKVITEATEETPGEKKFTCSVCGGTYTEEIPVKEHEHHYTTVSTDPTCTEQGYTTYTCTCGYSYKDDYVDALGHDLVNPTYNSSAKTHTFSCSRCDYTKTENCTFDQGKVITEATEETPGVKEFTCTVCGGTYTEEFAYIPPEAASVTRISGSSRYETAMAIADELKNELGVETFDTILVASGDNYPDALAGSYLAVQKDAPILLAQNKANSEVNGSVIDYIEKNLDADGKVLILGGTVAVSQAFEDGLKEAGIVSQRLAGMSRFETCLEILKEAGMNGNEILVCTGWSFYDALSVSALNKPILLVDSKEKKLTDEQVEYLDALEDDYTFYIIGGTAAVPEAFEAALAKYGTVERVAGAGRYETAVAVAEKFFENPDCATLAYAGNYPDGLCGGPLAYKNGAPLLLVDTKYPNFAADYVEANSIKKGIVFGGTSVVTDDTVAAVFGLPQNTEVSKGNP